LSNGDVIEKHDVFGAGVNIAARLEQIAPPGGLCPMRGCVSAGPGDVATGVRQARRHVRRPQDHPRAHDNGDRRRRLLCGAGGHCGHGDGDIDFEADKFGLKREERGQP